MPRIKDSGLDEFTAATLRGFGIDVPTPPKPHGMAGTPIYQTWQGMLSRCTNPNATGFKNYGGRGISVCARWSDWRTGFESFIADMGPKPSLEYSIDRINNDGNYEPGNCH